MTPEERIAGLEKEVVNLALMLNSLCWGTEHHNLSHNVYARVLQQRDADHSTPKAAKNIFVNGRRFR